MKIFGLNILTNNQLARVKAEAVQLGAKAAINKTNRQMTNLLDISSKLVIQNKRLVRKK